MRSGSLQKKNFFFKQCPLHCCCCCSDRGLHVDLGVVLPHGGGGARPGLHCGGGDLAYWGSRRTSRQCSGRCSLGFPAVGPAQLSVGFARASDPLLLTRSQQIWEDICITRDPRQHRWPDHSGFKWQPWASNSRPPSAKQALSVTQLLPDPQGCFHSEGDTEASEPSALQCAAVLSSAG